MSIKISPFNVHTVNRYGLKKLEELDKQHRAKKLNATPSEVSEVVDDVVEEVAEEVVEEVVVATPVVEEMAEQPEPEEVVEESTPSPEPSLPEWDEDPVEDQAEGDGLESLSEDDLRELAKSLDIDYWWTKGEERLIDEIRRARGE